MIPNKTTLIAAALYSLLEVEDRKSPHKLWNDAPVPQKAVFLDAVTFMSQYVLGADINKLDRAKLAAAVEQKIEGIDANQAVVTFLNIWQVLG